MCATKGKTGSAASRNLFELLQRHSENIAGGTSSDDKWPQHCSRILKLSTIFSKVEMHFRVCISLLSAMCVDTLHFDILGSKAHNKRRATLSMMVDPYTSIVGSAMDRVFALIEDYRIGSLWDVLQFFGVLDLNEPAPKQFAMEIMNFTYFQQVLVE